MTMTRSPMATNNKPKPAPPTEPQGKNDDESPPISQAARLHLSQLAALQICDLCDGLSTIDPELFEDIHGYASVVMAIAKRASAGNGNHGRDGDEDAEEDDVIRELDP